MKPSIGEANLGALVGAIVGATGGLFAIGIAPAILERKLAMLFLFPTLGLMCMLLSGTIGWLLGGQIGPRLGYRFNSPRAEITGGAVSGLVPVILAALWGWYMKTH
jgi:hypothetical protein